MRLRDKPFERRVWSKIRSLLTESPALREEYRRWRKRRRQILTTKPWMVRVFFTLVIGFFLALMPRSVEQIVALIVLWTLGSVFLRAAFLNGFLYVSPALTVFNYLPIADDRIFKVQWNAFLRGSLWSAVDFSILYFTLALKGGVGTYALVTGVALGLVQWFFVVALATGLFVLGVRKHFFMLALLCLGSSLALLFFGPLNHALSKWIAALAFWLPPMGWLIHAAGITASRGLPLDLVPVVSAAMVLVIFPIAYQHARRRYALNEKIMALAWMMTSTGRPGIVEYLEAAQEFQQAGPEVAAGINRGELRVSVDWRRLGMIERLISRVLNERERVLADFLLAGNPQWTARFRKFVIFALVLVAVSTVWPSLRFLSGPMLIGWGAGLFLAAFAAQWRGFMWPRGGGLQSPVYALYPIGIKELLGMMLKVNAVRFFIYLPVCAVAAWMIWGGTRLNSYVVFLTAVKGLLLGLFSMPLMPLFQISPGTNDGRKPMLVVAALVCFLVLMAALATIVASISFWVVLGAGAVFGATSSATLFVYARLYNRGYFDLVTTRIEGKY